MAASTQSSQRHLTNPLLVTSTNLASKYVSSDRKLLGHGSSSSASVVASNYLAQRSTSSNITALTRNQSSGGGGGVLSSSSGTSLITTSSSDINNTKASTYKSTRDAQALRKPLTSGGKLSGMATRSNLAGKSELISTAKLTSYSKFTSSSKLATPCLVSNTALSVKSTMALTSLTTVSGSANRGSTSHTGQLTTVSGSLLRSANTSLKGRSGELGRDNLVNTWSGLTETKKAVTHLSSLKTANLLLTSTAKLSPVPRTSQLVANVTKGPLTASRSKPLSMLSHMNTKMKPISLNTEPSKMLNSRKLTHGHFVAKQSELSKSSVVKKPLSMGKTSTSKQREGSSECNLQVSSITSAVAKPITKNTEGAPKYDFSSSPHTKVITKKRQLFVNPELDPSLQAVPTPAADIAELKRTLLNAVATSLLCSPDFRNPRDPTHKTLTSLGERLSQYDPEFILKLSIYTRLNLNIRTTANFLLALAAKLPLCRPYLRKYFSATVRLPSDWIEVAEIYQAFQDENIKSGAIPTSLRKVMGSKFTEFDAYQLAKYNKDSSKKKSKKPSKEDRETKKTEEKKTKYKADFPSLNASYWNFSSSYFAVMIRSCARYEFRKPSDSDSSVVLSDSENKKEIERLSFTLKQLIRKIHISEPVEYVMCLVGKKYPEDPESFRKSRLPDMWDQERAGKRMKLPTPETWETQVSTKGNKANTWQDLIDHNKLPFMAMLRNLRNLILAGVSTKHHQWVIKKLNDERAVVNSKQFPFRFFSAYEVLGGLEKIADGEKPPERGPRGAKKKKPKKPKEMPEIDKTLLQKYKKALDSALKIATCYNVKPISGSTLILCNVGRNMSRPCTAARGLGKPRQVVEVGILLGLMCKYSCEKSTMLIYGNNDTFTEVELAEGTILHNMEQVMTAATAHNLTSNNGTVPFSFLTKMLINREHVDNIVLLTDAMKLNDEQGREAMDFLRKYRHFVNPELLFVSVDLSGASSGVSSTIIPEHPNDIYLAGYSDQILRFIAERGDSGQLTYVENIDKAFDLTGIKLPSLAESATTEDTTRLLSLSSEKTLMSTAQGQIWRTVRVFISSTFKDMHGERDLLTRFVFPELRARAHTRQIHVYEVDLRWGVTEQDARSHKALEICLQEISRSQYFIGLLGQRYGWIQEEYQVPDTPEFDWLQEFPTQKSITEVEMYHAALRNTDEAVDKAFFYFRDPSFLDKVPQQYRADFESESDVALEKIEALKSDIFLSGLEVYNNYPCRWLGEIQNKPMVGGLESFGQRVLHSLWNAIQKDYPEDELEEDPISQATAQHTAFGETRASNFIGRRTLLQKAKAALESPDNKLVVVTGKAGCGKSAFMAAVTQEYAANSHSNVSLDLVISHFIGAAPDSTNIAQLLTRLCHELKRRFQVTRDVPDDYTDLVREWQCFLEDSVTNLGKVNFKIVIVIDGVDLLEEKHNGRSLDWIPEEIPDGVVLMISGVEGGMGITNLRKRKNPPSEIVIGPLDMFDKAEMVRKKLLKHRKTLDESPFNNQMKFLLTKKDAINPLFLHLACEELRVFGVFEEVTAYLKKIPTTISNLLQEILQRLETEHTAEIISLAMIFLTQVRHGLLEYELTQVLQLALKELYPDKEESLPPMVVSKLLRSLQSFLQPTGQEMEDMLSLAHKDIEKAVKLRYTRGADNKKETQLHLLLATFFRAEADPHGNGTFKGNSGRAFTELPYHLMEAGAWKELEQLVCSINFVIAKSQLGLAHQLLEDYTPITVGLPTGKSREVSKFIQQPAVQEYKSFVSRNLHILLKNPSLALQQALNEPSSSTVAIASTDARQESSSSVMMWVNKPETTNPCHLNILSQTGAVLCVSVSQDSSLFAAGYKNGAVKVYEVATGKEAHTFIGHAAGITDVCFVGTHSVCSASSDTTLSLWDTKQGIRKATLKGHSRGVHGCSADKTGRCVVSVSWDTSIKVWEGRSGKFQATLKTQGQHNTPINCVSFHPEGQLVVVGSWDTTLKIWDTLNQKRIKVFKGHKSSIQACSYAPSGHHIVSAALDGEVKVWSTKSGTAVGTITGHHSPVNGIVFTPNGQYLATASSDKAVKVWSGSLGQPISSIGSSDLGFVHQIAFDHVTQSVSVGYHDGHIRQFNIETGTELVAVKPHSAPVVGLARHGNLHMSAFADGTMKVCDFACLPTSVELRGHVSPVTCAVWGRKGFASASEDFCILIWPHQMIAYTKMLQSKGTVKAARAPKKKRAKTKVDPEPSKIGERELIVTPLATLRTEHTGKITSIAFSCDGAQMAAVSHDQNISIWSCIRHQLIKVLHSCHKDWITTCSFSDSSPGILVTGSTDFTLKVWDVNSGTEKTTFKGHTSAINSVAVSQGCVVSGAFDGSVKVWTHKGVEITTMYCHKQRVNTCLLHMPSNEKAKQLTSSWADIEDEAGEPKTKVQLDQILVLTGSDDGTVGVWKPFLPNEITSLIGHSGHVLSVSSTLNNQLLTCSNDGSIRMWRPSYPSTPLGHLTLQNTSKGHTGPITSLSAQTAGKDATFVLSGGRDGYTMVWEMTTTKVAKLYQVKKSDSDKATSAVCFTTFLAESQSGTFMAGSDSGEVQCYKFDKMLSEHTHTIGAALMGPHPISKLVLTADGKHVIAGSWSSKITAINSDKKTTRSMGQHKGWVMDLVTVGHKVYSIGLDNTLYCWTLPSASPAPSGSGTTYPLGMTRRGKEGLTWTLSLCEVQGTNYLAISDNMGKVSLWNKVRLGVELTEKLHSKQVNVVCSVSDGCFMTGSDDGTVKVWRVGGEGGRGAAHVRLTQVGQFYCQACVTAIAQVRGGGKSGKNQKPMFVVGDSLGHVTLLQWLPADF